MLRAVFAASSVQHGACSPLARGVLFLLSVHLKSEVCILTVLLFSEFENDWCDSELSKFDREAMRILIWIKLKNFEISE